MATTDFSNAAMANTLERHANILRSVRRMALNRRGLSPDENRMMEAAIEDMDAIAEQLAAAATGGPRG